MKSVILFNVLFPFCSFRAKYSKQSYHLTKHVCQIFTNCTDNFHSVIAQKADKARLRLYIPSFHRIVSSQQQISGLKNHSDFKVNSLWDETDESEHVNDDRENGSKTNKYESHTLKKEAYDQELHLVSLLEKNRDKADQLKKEGWEEIKMTTLKMPGNIYEENFDAYIMNMCSDLKCLPLGKSYYNYLKSTNSPINRATFGSYLRLFYVCAQSCTDNDLQEIYSVYKELTQVYQTIDCYTAEKAISALSLTKHWKEYERLFNIIELSYVPYVHTYTIVITTAFRNKEFDLGWKLITEMKDRGLAIVDDVFFSWLESQNFEDREKSITFLLEFFIKYNLKPSVTLCEHLKHILEKHPTIKRGTWTSITRRGNCRTCNLILEKAYVKEEDFNRLKKAFLNPVLIGKDIFLKTQPQEFKSFLDFLGKTAPYDVVLDGLNIALNAHKSRKSPSIFSFQLKSVVKRFANEDKKVLVVGKKHMLKWPNQDMQQIFENAKVFLADNLSFDDPFVLYATLYSGLGTMFVSRDMMRGHKFLLNDPQLQATFHKWQSQHQYFIKYIEDNGQVHLNDPIPFMQSIQRNSRGDWHIPYLVKEELTQKSVVDNFHKHWMCLSSHSTRQPARPSFRPQFNNQNNNKMGQERPNKFQSDNFKRWR